MKVFIYYIIAVTVLCSAYLAAGLPYYNFVPAVLFALLWLPGMFNHMNKSLAYRDLLVKKGLVRREVLKSSILSTFKTYVKSEDSQVESGRKDVINSMRAMALIFIFFTLMAIATVYR